MQIFRTIGQYHSNNDCIKKKTPATVVKLNVKCLKLNVRSFLIVTFVVLEIAQANQQNPQQIIFGR
jgi:hypothetical protein